MTAASRYCSFAFLLVAILFVSQPATFAADGDNSSGKASVVDQAFMNKAWIINTAEIALGHLAQDKASNADVKAFGNHMIDEHTTANTQLAQLAQQQQAALPKELDQEHQEMKNKLSKLSGAEFDKEYMNGMIMGHQKALAAFEAEAKNDSAAGKWAADMVPHLKEHLQMAVKAGKTVGASAANEQDHMGK